MSSISATCFAALFFVSLSTLVTACSNRDHNNPFDPKNPSTGGRPITVTAIPSERSVTIYWSIPNMEALSNGTLMRQFEGHESSVVIADISESGRTVDLLYPSTRNRSYWLDVAADGWDGIHTSDTASVVLTPGSCWLASDHDGISLLSPKSSSLLPTVHIGSFIVDVSSGANGLWTAGMPGGYLNRVQIEQSTITRIDDLSTALQIAAISVARHGRILIAHQDGLEWFDPDEHTLTPWPLFLSSEPVVARIAPEEDAAWLHTADGTLSFVPSDSEFPHMSWQIGQLHDLVPTEGRTCWAATVHGLIRIDVSDSIPITVSSMASAISPMSSESCWVASSVENQVSLLSANGEIVRRQNIPGIRLLSYSREDSVLWIVRDDDVLLKLNNDLSLAARVELPQTPWALRTADD